MTMGTNGTSEALAAVHEYGSYSMNTLGGSHKETPGGIAPQPMLHPAFDAQRVHAASSKPYR